MKVVNRASLRYSSVLVNSRMLAIMNLDRYGNAAAAACARLTAGREKVKSPAVVITSSIADTPRVLECAEGFAAAVSRLNKRVALVDAMLGGRSAESGISVSEKGGITLVSLKPSNDNAKKINDKSAAAILDKLRAEYDFIVIAADSISFDDTAVFFAAQSNGVILCEVKKSSRTDEIEKAVEAIKCVGANPLGFILAK